jgi:hypothetical protein
MSGHYYFNLNNNLKINIIHSGCFRDYFIIDFYLIKKAKREIIVVRMSNRNSIIKGLTFEECEANAFEGIDYEDNTCLIPILPKRYQRVFNKFPKHSDTPKLINDGYWMMDSLKPNDTYPKLIIQIREIYSIIEQYIEILDDLDDFYTYEKFYALETDLIDKLRLIESLIYFSKHGKSMDPKPLPSKNKIRKQRRYPH